MPSSVVVLGMNTSQPLSFRLTIDQFVEGGAFYNEIIGELGREGSRTLVISTDHPQWTEDGPTVCEISSDLYAVFYRKSFLAKVWGFVEAALQGTDLEPESDMRMVGATLSQAVMALYRHGKS